MAEFVADVECAFFGEMAVKEGFGDGHEEGGWDAFVGYVADDEIELVVVVHDVIEEVAADGFGGFEEGVDIEGGVAGEGRVGFGEHGLLDVVGDAEVVLYGDELVVLGLEVFDETDVGDGFVDGGVEVVEIDGLGDEVEGAFIHGGADVFHVAIGGYHDGFEGGVVHVVYVPEEGESVHFGHIYVAKGEEYVGMLLEHLECFDAVVSEYEFVFFFANLFAEFLLN